MAICDHKSVGILVRKNDRLLLIERRRPPYGFAPPAGHVDGRQIESAAVSELAEEVGLKAVSLTCVAQGRRQNKCRRMGGDWHDWWIFEATVTGEIDPNPKEVGQVIWCTEIELQSLAERTQRYKRGLVSALAWQADPGLEPVWLDWLLEIGELNNG
jgi:ADP-ribose pyrophosphatase YjhB (NUDIX family)